MLLHALLLLSLSASGAENKSFLPASVPVNFRPDENEGRLLSVGVNRLSLKTAWEDNFFSPRSERIGDTKVTANGVSLGLIRNRGPRYSEEWDLLAGHLSFEAITKRYHSEVINKTVNVDASGKGFDLGARYLGGCSLGKSDLGGPVRADWTLGISLHALLFSLENRYTAESADKLDANSYEERDIGLFLRPSLSIQPVFDFGKSASIIPFAGLSAMAIAARTEYEDSVFRRGGVNGKLTSSTDFYGVARGPDLTFGFDLAIRPKFLKGHRVLLGGALTKLLGGTDGDFSELHLAYSFPF